MIDTYSLYFNAFLWIVCGFFLIKYFQKKVGVGLVGAYFLQLFILFGLGGLLYCIPEYADVSLMDTELVIEGYKQSTYAIIAFTLAAVFLAPSIRPVRIAEVKSASFYFSYRLPIFLIFLGLASFFLRKIIFMSSVIAIICALNQLLPAGIVLGLWQAHLKKHRYMKSIFLSLFLLPPLLSLVFQGFLGFGALTTFTLIMFLYSSFPSKKAYLVLFLLGYFLVSFFSVYLAKRLEFRAVAWSGESIKTFSALEVFIDEFQWLDLKNIDIASLQQIDSRLNQNILLGRSIYYLEHGYEEFAKGETLIDAALALIPRILWPDKPMVGGSGNLMSRYTGEQFALGTSVGITPVIEAYINFGRYGVISIFLFLGILMGHIDRKAKHALCEGDQERFIMWYMPGLGFLQVSGSFVEVTSTVFSLLIAAWMTVIWLKLKKKKKYIAYKQHLDSVYASN